MIVKKSGLEIEELKKTKSSVSNRSDEFKCPICDKKCKNKVDLSNHYRDQVCQTDIPEVNLNKEKTDEDNVEYRCFYCGKSITNAEENLNKPHRECREPSTFYRGNIKNLFQPVSPFQFPTTYPPPFVFPTDVTC